MHKTDLLHRPALRFHEKKKTETICGLFSLVLQYWSCKRWILRIKRIKNPKRGKYSKKFKKIAKKYLMIPWEAPSTMVGFGQSARAPEPENTFLVFLFHFYFLFSFLPSKWRKLNKDKSFLVKRRWRLLCVITCKFNFSIHHPLMSQVESDQIGGKSGKKRQQKRKHLYF